MKYLIPFLLFCLLVVNCSKSERNSINNTNSNDVRIGDSFVNYVNRNITKRKLHDLDGLTGKV